MSIRNKNLTFYVNGIDITNLVIDTKININMYKNTPSNLTLNLGDMDAQLYDTYIEPTEEHYWKDAQKLSFKVKDSNDVYIFVGRVRDVFQTKMGVQLNCESELAKLKDKKVQFNGLIESGKVTSIDEGVDDYILDDFESYADDSQPSGWSGVTSLFTSYAKVKSEGANSLYKLYTDNVFGLYPISASSCYYENPLLLSGGYIEFKIKTNYITPLRNVSVSISNFNYSIKINPDSTLMIIDDNGEHILKDPMVADTFYTVKIYEDSGDIKVSLDTTYKFTLSREKIDTTNPINFKFDFNIGSKVGAGFSDLIFDDLKIYFARPPTNEVVLEDENGDAFTWSTNELSNQNLGLLIENSTDKLTEERNGTVDTTFTETDCTQTAGTYTDLSNPDGNKVIVNVDKQGNMEHTATFEVDLFGDDIEDSNTIKDIIIYLLAEDKQIYDYWHQDIMRPTRSKNYITLDIYNNTTSSWLTVKRLTRNGVTSWDDRNRNNNTLSVRIASLSSKLSDYIVLNVHDYQEIKLRFSWHTDFIGNDNIIHQLEIDYLKVIVEYDTKDYEPFYTGISSNTATGLIPSMNIYEYGVVAGDKFKICKNSKQMVDDILQDVDIILDYNISTLISYFVSESYDGFPLDLLQPILKSNQIYLFEDYQSNGTCIIRLIKESEADYLRTVPTLYDFEDEVELTTTGGSLEIVDLSDGIYDHVLKFNLNSTAQLDLADGEGLRISGNIFVLSIAQGYIGIKIWDEDPVYKALEIYEDSGNYFVGENGVFRHAIDDPEGSWHSFLIEEVIIGTTHYYKMYWDNILCNQTEPNGTTLDKLTINTVADCTMYLDNLSISYNFLSETISNKYKDNFQIERKSNQYKSVKVTGNLRSNQRAYWIATDPTVTNLSTEQLEWSSPQLITETSCKEMAEKLLDFYKVVRPTISLAFEESSLVGRYKFGYGYKVPVSMSNPTISEDMLITNVKYSIDFPYGVYEIQLDLGVGETTETEEFVNRLDRMESDIRLLKSQYSGENEYNIRQILNDEAQASLNADLTSYLLKSLLKQRCTFVLELQDKSNPVEVSYSDGSTYVQVSTYFHVVKTEVYKCIGSTPPTGMTRRFYIGIDRMNDASTTGEKWKLWNNVDAIFDETGAIEGGAITYRNLKILGPYDWDTYAALLDSSALRLAVCVKQVGKKAWYFGTQIIVEDYFV